jgi:hypothetical protein
MATMTMTKCMLTLTLTHGAATPRGRLQVNRPIGQRVAPPLERAKMRAAMARRCPC